MFENLPLIIEVSIVNLPLITTNYCLRHGPACLAPQCSRKFLNDPRKIQDSSSSHRRTLILRTWCHFRRKWELFMEAHFAFVDSQYDTVGSWNHHKIFEGPQLHKKKQTNNTLTYSKWKQGTSEDMMQHEERRSLSSPPTNVLPAGNTTISLPSEQCDVAFHVSSKTDVPLLDDTTAKRRQKLNKFNDHGSISLPKGEKVIRLESKECEDTFHLSQSAGDSVLLLKE